MESNEFDELLQHAKEVGKALHTFYREVTGEELNIEGAIRHYPLVAVGLAAGAGAVGGWWLARKRQPQLPPPAASPPVEPSRTFRELTTRLRTWTEGEQGIERVRNLVPEPLRDEAAAMAQNWVDTVLEPRVKEGLDKTVSRVSGSKLGSFLQQQMQRLEEQEHELPDEPDADGQQPPANR